MSSAARVAAYASAATASPPLSGAPLAREIASLRAFIVKHQDEPLARDGVLCTALLAHARNPAARARAPDGGSLALGLLEDALKLPERVVATAHKRALLKLHAAETARLDAAIAEAKEKHGDVEVGAAVTAKAVFLGFIGAKDAALKTYTEVPEKAVSTGGKADVAMAALRIALVHGDHKCVRGARALSISMHP
jgi:hypothetical protein